MKILKNLIIAIITIFCVISCSSFSAEAKFKNGDYLGALEESAKELKKDDPKSEITVKARIRLIEKNLKDTQSKTNPQTYEGAINNLDIWAFGRIIEKNPNLKSLIRTPLSPNYKENFIQGIDSLTNYIENSQDIEKYYTISKALDNYGAADTDVKDIFLNFIKKGTNAYVSLGDEYFNEKDYKNSLDAYETAVEISENYYNNLYNSKSKYLTALKNYDYEIAYNDLNTALNYYDSGDYENAKSKFITAYDIYNKYEDSKTADIANYINRIMEILYNQYYDLAIRNLDNYFYYRDSKSFEKAEMFANKALANARTSYQKENIMSFLDRLNNYR